MLGYVILYYVIICHIMSYYVMLCHVLICYVVLWYVTLQYEMLCYVIEYFCAVCVAYNLIDCYVKSCDGLWCAVWYRMHYAAWSTCTMTPQKSPPDRSTVSASPTITFMPRALPVSIQWISVYEGERKRREERLVVVYHLTGATILKQLEGKQGELEEGYCQQILTYNGNTSTHMHTWTHVHIDAHIQKYTRRSTQDRANTWCWSHIH